MNCIEWRKKILESSKVCCLDFIETIMALISGLLTRIINDDEDVMTMTMMVLVMLLLLILM